MKTIQQSYAQQVYEKVQSLNQEERKVYGAMAHKLPVLVRQAGLIQAIAFVATRGQKAQKLLLDHLASTLGYTNQDELYTRVREASLQEYALLTRQALWALEWYKRFAQSILGVNSAEETNHE